MNWYPKDELFIVDFARRATWVRKNRRVGFFPSPEHHYTTFTQWCRILKGEHPLSFYSDQGFWIGVKRKKKKRLLQSGREQMNDWYLAQSWIIHIQTHNMNIWSDVNWMCRCRRCLLFFVKSWIKIDGAWEERGGSASGTNDSECTGTVVRTKQRACG